MDSALLSEEEIDQRLALLNETLAGGAGALGDGEGAGGISLPSSPSATPTYIRPLSDVADAPLYVRPLGDVAESLIESLHSDEGIGLGLPEIDILTRGFRPTDLVLITGFASAGKTQIVNTMLANNLDKRILFFSLDDPAEMILAKLVPMHTGANAEEIEKRLMEGDEETRKVIRDVAQNVFTNLIVVDDVIGLDAMEVAIREAADAWGAEPHAVIIDYDELMPDDTGRTDESFRLKALLNQIKARAKTATFPWIVLHQGTRTNSRPGEPITLVSLGHSGEQQATLLLGIRRKRVLKELSPADKLAHEDTCTIHLVKNKRPGGRCSHYEGVDFYLDAPTGRIRPLSESERRRLYEPQSATAVAHRASTQTRWELP